MSVEGRVTRDEGFGPDLHLWFGTGFPTALPAGWVLKESPVDFAQAIDPAGQKYFLGMAAAFPQRVATEPRGALKPGDVYLDSECGVVPLVSIAAAAEAGGPRKEGV